MRRIVVSGLGVVSPLGSNVTSFRDALMAGRSGVGPVTTFDASTCRTRRAATVTGFDAAAWIPPMKLRRMDDTSRYAVVITRQALDDGAYAFTPDGHDSVGVILGTCTAGGQPTTEYLAALHAGGATGAPAIIFNSTVANAPASLAGLEYRLRGPNITVGLKEASSLSAIATAIDMLRLGRATAIVTGGVDAIFEIYYRVHDRFAVMAPDGRTAAPFDAARSGFLLGEGGYALLLEDASVCDARGARSYGEVLGMGAGSAAVAINQWPDDPEPLARTMRAALDDAHVAPEDVGVIYASANGAPILDAVEAAALRQVFGSARPVVTSLKGSLGECGAGGAAACIAALSCGRDGSVPPTVGLEQLDAAAADLNVARTATRVANPIVLVNSVGSGGSIASVVLRVERAS
jgi:3-oxoacyl-[acyl-carrier-protein] synthase II